MPSDKAHLEAPDLVSKLLRKLTGSRAAVGTVRDESGAFCSASKDGNAQQQKNAGFRGANRKSSQRPKLRQFGQKHT